VIDVDLRCPETLKVISERYLGDESARLRFLREARAAASVRHPNVASVLHLGRTGSSYFYAMEFVKGETLDHQIKRSGRLEVQLARWKSRRRRPPDWPQLTNKHHGEVEGGRCHRSVQNQIVVIDSKPATF